MAFDAGSVETRLGFAIDDREIKRYRKLVEAAAALRADAQLGGTLDDAAFRQIDDLLADVQGSSATAQLEADVDRSGFREFDGEVNDADGSSATARLSAAVDEDGFKGFRLQLSKTVGAAGAAGAAIGAALIAGMNGSIEDEVSNDRLAAQLDLNAQESGRYGKLAGDLYANAYGESLDGVNEALGGVLSSVRGMRQASDEELQEQTAHALDFAGTFGVEAERITQSVGTAIQSNLAESSEEAFDIITKASQRVPAALREDLLDASDEYGQFFTQLGYGGETTFGLLSDAAAKGTFGIDKIGDAVKEFTILSTDMSQSSKDAYKAIGLDAQTMAEDILAGGDKAKGATQKIIDGLLEIEDPVARANASIALFGTPLEDLAVKDIPQFLTALKDTSGGMEDVTGAADRMGTNLNTNTAGRLETAKRKISRTFKNLGHEIVVGLEAGLGAAENLGKKIGGPVKEGLAGLARDSKGELKRFGRAFDDAKEIVGDTLGKMKKSIDRVFGGESGQVLRDFGRAVRSAIGVALDVIGRLVRLLVRVAGEYLPKMADAFEGVLTIVRGVMKVITGLLTGDFGKVWDGLGDIAAGGLKALKGVISAGTAPIRAAVGAIGDAIGDGISNGWNAAGRVAASVVNGIISIITKIPGVPDIAPVSWGAKKTTKTVNNTGTDSSRGKKVGTYAEGGKVTEPIAIMGEEAPAHPEWVIPTNPAYRQRAVGLWMAAAQELGIPGFSQGGLAAKVGGKIKDIAGDVGGAAADVLRATPVGQIVGTAADMIGDLPKNPGGLLKGTMSYVLDKAKGYIRDKVQAILPGQDGGETGAGVKTGTLGIANHLAKMFGLRLTSTYRSPAANAAAGGVPGSHHMKGSPSNPGATDLVGSGAAMQAASAYAGKYGPVENMIHDVGSGLHLHLAWFSQGGKTAARKAAAKRAAARRKTQAKAQDMGISSSAGRHGSEGTTRPGKVDPKKGRLSDENLARYYARQVGTFEDFDPLQSLKDEARELREAKAAAAQARKDAAEAKAKKSGKTATSLGADGSEIDAFNRAYPSKITSSPTKGMTVFSSEMVKKLAAKVGLPPRVFDLIAKGESGRAPGIQQPDPGDGMVGYGLWQNTPNAWGKASAAYAKFQNLGGVKSMFVPMKNALMAKFLYDNAPSKTPKTKGFPWYGTQYLARGGKWGGETLRGGVQAFKKGGRAVFKKVKQDMGAVIAAGVPKNEGVERSVKRAESGITVYENRIQNLEREYSQLDRRHSVEPLELLTENADGSSTVNMGAVNQRVAQIEALIAKREAIKAQIEEYRAKILELMSALRAAIGRLQAAMKATKGKARSKTRAGYATKIDEYQERLGELGQTWGDLGYDAEDANIDLAELQQEKKEVKETKGVASTPSSDTKEPPTTDSPDPVATAPSPAEIAAEAAKQVEAFMGARSGFLKELGSNVGDSAFSSMGGRTALETAAAGRQYGYAGTGTTAPVTNNWTFNQSYGGAPEQPDAWNALVRHSAAGAA